MKEGTGSEIAFNFSEGFQDWLATENISLLASTYQANRILSIGSMSKKIWMRQYPFKNCMGFYERNGAMLISSASKISLLTSLKGNTQRAPFDPENDRVYYPRTEWVTGDLKTHDIVMCGDDSIVFVNTDFDCLATVDSAFSFKPIWQPPYFKGARQPEARDCSHLNGLALRSGRPAFVTGIGRSTVSGGWREHKRSGGLLFDLETDSLLSESLSMPHSPRWYKGQLWLLNSGTGQFGYFNLNTGKFIPTIFCPGFARGLAFHKHWAVITLSNMRRYKGFDGLVLGEELDRLKINPICGAIIVNLNTGAIDNWFNISGSIKEFYDISISDCLRPSIILSEDPITQKVVLAPNF